jgi:hypothetical protein
LTTYLIPQSDKALEPSATVCITYLKSHRRRMMLVTQAESTGCGSTSSLDPFKLRGPGISEKNTRAVSRPIQAYYDICSPRHRSFLHVTRPSCVIAPRAFRTLQLDAGNGPESLSEALLNEARLETPLRCELHPATHFPELSRASGRLITP